MATLSMEPRKWIIIIYNSCDQACKIDHVSANYTELYFAVIFHSECDISSMSFRRKLIKFCSSDEDSGAVASINS